MKTLAHTLALTAGLAAAGTTLASAETLGDRVTAGTLSPRAFHQLVAHTGLNADEAARKTLHEIIRLRLENDS